MPSSVEPAEPHAAMILAPSILSADFLRLEEQVRAVLDAGADWIHIDVMDGRFVPNISFGIPILRSLRPLRDASGTLLDVHLMIADPDRYLEAFRDAGADRLTVHAEACPHLHRTVQRIRELGVKPGVALNPATPLSAVEEILPDLDLVLVMSVNPGFGGQSFIPGTFGKLRRMRELLDTAGVEAWIEVDGGVEADNAAEIVAAGADALVVGSAIFDGSDRVTENARAVRAAVES